MQVEPASVTKLTLDSRKRPTHPTNVRNTFYIQRLYDEFLHAESQQVAKQCVNQDGQLYVTRS